MLMEIPKDKKVYFASDNHLGAPNSTDSLIREKKFVKWLNEIRVDAHAIFLVGDIFDFFGLNIKKLCQKALQELLESLLKFVMQAYQFIISLEIMICGFKTIFKKK